MSERGNKATKSLALIPENVGAYKIEQTQSREKFSFVLLKICLPLLFFAWWFLVTSNTRILNQTSEIVVAIGSILSIFLTIAYLSFSNVLSNKYFVLTQKSITLPSLYWWATRMRLKWNWDQLTKLVFARSNGGLASADQIVLYFQVSPVSEPLEICVKLNEIDRQDLKKMIYAVVSSAPHVVIEPPLEKVALEFPTVSGIKHLNFNSFTSLWDEEFSTRYSPTLFVPLAPNDELKGGAVKIEELIACGGSAAIYSAKNLQGEQIIVKEAVIPKNSPEALKIKAIELFNREAQFLSMLDHPYIAKVFDHFVENEHHYEILEFIDGLDLRRFVKERGPQPEDFVLNWAEQICEILVYLHSQRPPVIHRDLTPDNLVLRVDGQLILIDFGAANAFVGTATGTMVGKQSYMPPEQLRGKAVPQSDIYSLGATCYFLLTGKDPTPLEVSRITEKDNLPMNLNPFLEKCTAGEYHDRFTSSLEVLHEIRNIRQRRVVEAASIAVQKSI